MRSENGNAVSAADQSSRQVPNKGPCRVAREARVGLGQEEEIQCELPYSTRSLTE